MFISRLKRSLHALSPRMPMVFASGSLPLPSPWIAEFASQADYEALAPRWAEAFKAMDAIDDRVLCSRHPFQHPAYCAACERVTAMRVDWLFGGAAGAGSVAPAWTETAACPECGLNSRMRALIDWLRRSGVAETAREVYLAEQTTASYRLLQGWFPRLVGSEYLGPEIPRGARRQVGGQTVRHEDLTALTWPDRSFDLVVTQDVFEHIPDYRAAFREIARVLRPAGRLVFTIPFFYDLATTRIRARLAADGIEHLLPPEIHGNPVSAEGSLCFQNFGWDILDDLRASGFRQARAALYWGPWQGHLGGPFFVFHAAMAET